MVGSPWWELCGLGVLGLHMLGPGLEDARTHRIRRGRWLRLTTLVSGTYGVVGLAREHQWGLELAVWVVVWVVVVTPFLVLFTHGALGGADVRYVAGPLMLTALGFGPLGLLWAPVALFVTSVLQLGWRWLRHDLRPYALVAWVSTTATLLAAGLAVVGNVGSR